MLCSGISITSRFKDSLRNTLTNGQEIYDFSSYFLPSTPTTKKKEEIKKSNKFSTLCKRKKNAVKCFEGGNGRFCERDEGDKCELEIPRNYWFSSISFLFFPYICNSKSKATQSEINHKVPLKSGILFINTKIYWNLSFCYYVGSRVDFRF